jgi:hypothetical protein
MQTSPTIAIASVVSTPRNITTKFGERSVVDIATDEGLKLALWGNPSQFDDLAIGQEITVAIDSKGRCQRVNTGVNTAPLNLPFEAQHQLQRQLRPAPTHDIDALAALYSHCLEAAQRIVPSDLPLNPTAVNAIALALFAAGKG